MHARTHHHHRFRPARTILNREIIDEEEAKERKKEGRREGKKGVVEGRVETRYIGDFFSRHHVAPTTST